MSIFATTESIRARQDEADQTSSKLTAAGDSADFIERLTAFMPAEMITIWAVALTLINPSQDWVRWVSLGGGVIVLLVILHLDLALKDKQAKQDDPKAQPVSTHRRIRAFAIATVSFLVWALATPGTPLTGNQSRWAVGAAVVLTAIITRYAKLWDIEPNNPT
jgi:hypothetical protein